MNDKITLDRDFFENDIINPLACILGEVEDTLDEVYVEELEVVLIKLNNAVKQAN